MEFEERCRDARSGYSIDVVVQRRSEAGSTNWAAKVDGPTHFLTDNRRLNRTTLLKWRHLGKMGYTVSTLNLQTEP